MGSARSRSRTGVVYHVYSTYARGTDVFNTFYQLLDRAPKGRDEDNPPDGAWCWRRHDEYDNRSERTWPSG
jgi:predicted dithiol-disulfide oxidoreductase (DUF899 family)